jgi:hypothetical protein
MPTDKGNIMLSYLIKFNDQLYNFTVGFFFGTSCPDKDVKREELKHESLIK